MSHYTRKERRENAQKRQLQFWVGANKERVGDWSLTGIVIQAIARYGLDQKYPLMDWAQEVTR